jgi:hypothetical protein
MFPEAFEVAKDLFYYDYIVFSDTVPSMRLSAGCQLAPLIF